ncbi:MAG: hypothetical protein V7607_2527 [Solirubrobacteraceae bacterium]
MVDFVGGHNVRLLTATVAATAATGVGLGCLVLIGVGLLRRARPALGWFLIVTGGLAAALLLVIWDWRPAMTMLAVTCLLAGMDLDARGHRAVAMLWLFVGLLALGLSLAA